MFIAVTSTTEELDGIVPKTFEESPFLMIIDADKNQIIKIYGKQDEKNMVFAQKVVDHDCEAVICGPIEKEPFELMAGKMVSRYDGSGHTVERAYKYMVPATWSSSAARTRPRRRSPTWASTWATASSSTRSGS